MKVYDVVMKSKAPVFVELGGTLGNRERVKNRNSHWWRHHVERIETERMLCFEMPVIVLWINPEEVPSDGKKKKH